MVPIKTHYANSKNYGGTRSTSAIDYIVIHMTANDGDTDEANSNYFANNVVKASAHLFVDDDSITQSVPYTRVAYSVGGSKVSDYKSTGGAKLYGVAKNANTINIELCDTVRDGVVYPSAKTIANTIDLVKMLMQKYNIPIDHVIRHFDVNGKHCPAYWMDDIRWNNEFLNLLKGKRNTYPEPTRTIKRTKPAMSGNDVRWVQYELVEAGYNIDIDGKFGGQSEKALLDYQRNHRLTADGKCGPATRASLKAH